MRVIDDKKFKELYMKTNLDVLAKRFGVTRGDIIYHAKKLGLTKRKIRIIGETKNENKK